MYRAIRLFSLRFSTVLAFVFAAACWASAQTIDGTFNPVPSIALGTSGPVQQVVQSDGKVIVYGFKGVADGVVKGDILRLNTDGTLDSTFNYCSCALTNITAIKLTPDGSLIVSGGIPGFAKMIRLNPDGSVDNGFSAVSQGPVPSFLGDAVFTVRAVQPDGKVLAMRRFSPTGNDFYYFRRYNTDGSVDDTFAEIPLTSGSPASASVVVEFVGDGRFLMGFSGGTSAVQSGSVTLRESDGTLAASGDAPNFLGTGFGGVVNISDISRESDGSVLVAGRWDTVNGLQRRNVVRLQSDGTLDLNFASPSGQWGQGVKKLADGKILYSVNTAATPFATPIFQLFRLNSDNTPDATFTVDPEVVSVLNRWALDSNERIVAFANTTTGPRIVRLLATGALDSSFTSNVTAYGSIYASATKSNGKVVLAGNFTQINGVSRGYIAIVNADGSLDNAFDPGAGFSSAPEQVLIQKDGKLLVRGPFTSYKGAPVSGGVARLNLNGDLDTSLTVILTGSRPLAMALQADGRIIIAGGFTEVEGVPRNGIARYAPSGALDQFYPILGGNGQVRAVYVQDDGMIMIGGLFAGVNGVNRTNLARLAPDGSTDASFNPGVLGTFVSGIWQQPRDGKYLLATGSGIGLLRRNNDGTADNSFAPPTFSHSDGALIDSVVLQQDGSMIVGGRFDTLAIAAGNITRLNVTRLLQNGTVDQAFMTDGADARVRSISRYSFSKLTFGGDFTMIATVLRPSAARVTVPTARPTLFDFNGDRRADFSLFRPSSGVWYELFAGGTMYGATAFGATGDIPVPGDFDGDGVTDEAIFRPSTGEWWFLSSLSGEFAGFPFGQSGDVPRPFDFDGDGRTDFVIYRPSTGTWYRYSTATGYAPTFLFGTTGDIPITGDFDGDGKGDIAVFRPSTGVWWYAASSEPGSFRALLWGQSGDIPVPGDYDADGKTDFGVFRPSNGVWYILGTSTFNYISFAFGTNGDRPVAADYDGDGNADIAVYRPSQGTWYLFQSTAGFGAVPWGATGDLPVPNVFLP